MPHMEVNNVKSTHECSHEYHTISAFMAQALAQLKEIYPMLLNECIAEWYIHVYNETVNFQVTHKLRIQFENG